MLRGILFIIILLSGQLRGQDFNRREYLERDSLISASMKAEEYAVAVNLIDKQFSFIKKHGIYDSMFRYCYDYGRAIWKSSKAEDGLAAAKRISNEVQVKDADILHYLQTVNDLSWLYYETGNVRKCLENDSLYLEICLANEGIPVNLISIAHYNLGFDYTEFGRYAEALKCFQNSVDVLLESNDTLPERLSMGYNAMGAMQWRLGNFEAAKTSYTASLALIESKTDPKSQLEKGNIIGNMALILEDNGEIIKAKEYTERFIKIDMEALPLIEDVYLRETALRRMSGAYINLGNIYFNLGDYDKARKLIQLAIEERKKILEPGDPSIASTLENMAMLEIQVGNLTLAEAKLREYLDYCMAYFGSKSANTARALKGLGWLFKEKGNYSQAEIYYEQALQSQRSAGDPVADPALANIYRERARLFVSMKKYNRAMSDIQKSYRIYQQSRDEHNPVFIGLLLEMSEVLIEQEKYQEALESIEKAFLLIDYPQDPGSIKGRERLMAQLPYLLPNAFYLRASTNLKVDSSEVTLRAALTDLQEAIGYLNSAKQNLMDHESKLLLFESHTNVFNLAQDIAYQMFVRTRNDHWIEELFRLTEENRTILLRNRLNSFSALDYTGVPDSLLAKERNLSTLLKNESKDPEITKRTVELERQLQDLKQLMRQHYPDYFALRYGDLVSSLEEVRSNLLSEDNSLLIYSLTDEFIYILLLDQSITHLLRVDKNDLEKQVNDLNDALVSLDQKRVSLLSGLLYEKLFKPVDSLILKNRLTIIPDGILFFLNFEILQKETSNEAFDLTRLLINDYVISYQLSATVAIQFQRINKSRKEGLLTFAPGFSDQQKQNYLASVQDTSVLDKKYLNFIQQPFAVQSATQIASLFSGFAYTGDEANETKFKEEASGYGVIHLGTHAEINQSVPLMSNLVLSKNVNSDSLDDGYLHAYEIYQMPLRAELAVLTACETGLGQERSSEGVISLAHSFAYAGCPAIVMSLWRIDEKTSSAIVKSFYHYLEKGFSKDIALHRAKLDFLREAGGDLRLPYYWAGMVLLGNKSAIQLKASSGYTNMIISILAFSILSVLLFMWFRKRA